MILKKFKNNLSGRLKHLQVFQAGNLRSLVNKKVIWYGVNFVGGMSLGYVLGLVKAHVIIINKLAMITFKTTAINWDLIISKLSWVKDCFNWIISITPSTGFLSDVVAFQGAIIAIAIPLSLEIISRISERYQSGVITKKFSQEWVIKRLPIILVIDIISAISLKFFVYNDSVSSTLGKIIAWITFGLFLITVVLLKLFFDILRRYITDTTFLLDELFKDMEELLNPQTQNKKVDKKVLKSKQKQFVEALEATGDILVFETKNKKGEEKIKEGLKRIGEKMGQFLEMQKSRPEEFERLLLSQDFFDIYEKDKTNAQILLALNTEKHLVSFTAAVNQLLRIREAALEVNNIEIGLLATYNIIYLLKDISQIPNNPLLVEQLLKSLAEIRRSIKQNQDDSAYDVTISWYKYIVFNKLFDISYLELFDRYFFSCIKDIISKAQTSLFKSLVGTFVTRSIQLQGSGYENIEDYVSFVSDCNYQKYKEIDEIYQINSKIKTLKEQSQYIRTIKQQESCLGIVNEVVKLLQPCFGEVQKQEAKQKEDKLREDITSNLKFNNLIDIMFGAGAYCIFKQKYDYIEYLWNYNQPSDSNATWLNNDIVPNTLGVLINFYFNQRPKDYSFIWEDHHGSEIYYKKYFLLLLLREFQKNNCQKTIDQFRLSDTLDSRELINIRDSVDSFIELANKIKDDTDSLRTIGFNIASIDDDIESALIPFLESLKPKIEKQIKSLLKIQRISSDKVDEFKKDLTENFNKSTIIRNILSYYELYEERIHEVLEDRISPFSKIQDKAAFFEEWYSSYSDMGFTYGRDLARNENLIIIDEIANLCQEIDNIKLDTTIELFRNNLDELIIIAINSAHRFNKNTGKFNAKWQKDYPQMKVRGFEGCYKFGEWDIPVFRVRDNTINERILILDKSRLGKLVQYSPNSEIKREELTGIFHISVQSFSENQELMNNLLQNPPDCLTNLGDQVQQKDYLEQKVQIEISQTFQFEKHQDFQGYLIKLSNQDSSNLDNFIS
ncbi:hypothetical protein Cylst_0041 [Cylindrospermum stagnale PCC 7417]|uniref:Uncharacterized protein n=1 Tax=Cylindrospermum stagnale PCC 7417 TaxID=56107 RepID=K9WQG1_9NOST|nr:hypothetical protein Cylst_0041 [Cylindrospermum stagnale PCC 7417]